MTAPIDILFVKKNYNYLENFIIYFNNGFVEISLAGIGKKETWPGTLSGTIDGK